MNCRLKIHALEAEERTKSLTNTLHVHLVQVIGNHNLQTTVLPRYGQGDLGSKAELTPYGGAGDAVPVVVNTRGGDKEDPLAREELMLPSELGDVLGVDGRAPGLKVQPILS